MADQSENPASAPKSKSSLILVLAVGVLTLLGGSGATWFLLARGKNSASAAEKVEKKDPEFTVRLDSFTVNLDDQEESHFLRVTMELSLAHAPKGDPSAKDNAEGASSFPVARIRDTILTVLTAAKANELLTPEGKTALKRGLLTSLQQRVPEIGARDVYFTEFLVQH